MYKTVVAKKVRATFAAIGAGDPSPMLSGLGRPFSYRFVGMSALGGTRTSIAAMESWWERVFRLIPNANFEVRQIVVQGHPGKTRVATHATVRAPHPAGGMYENEFMQFMTLRFAKITEVITLEDTGKLEAFLAEVAAAGNHEALATPITD